MLMEHPKPTYEYIVRKFVEDTPNLAYIHVVEPGIQGATDGPNAEVQQVRTAPSMYIPTRSAFKHTRRRIDDAWD